MFMGNETKTTTHNLEAEQLILGAILMNNEALNHCEGLEPHHFHNPVNRGIYDIILQMVATGHTVNPIMLQGHADKSYLAKLMAGGTSIANISQYAAKVIDHAKNRSLKDVLIHGAQLNGSFEENLADVEAKLFGIAQEDRGNYEHNSTPGQSVIEQAERAHKHGGKISGIRTGIKTIDRALGGLNPSDLIIVAGRPSMGKTALAVNIGKRTAKEEGKSVGLSSMEMSSEQIMQRLLSGDTGLSVDEILSGRFNQTQFGELVEAQRNLAKLKIFIDDTPAQHINTLRSRARRMRKKGMELLIVDYLQLMRADGYGNRVQEVSEITMGLKAIAKELEIPVIALSQLSREVEKREDKRPQLSDLRDSGSIEQDADIVMLCYREEYYVERTKPDSTGAKYVEWLSKMEACKGKAEIIIAKNRHGPTAHLELRFDGRTTTFHDNETSPLYSQT